MKIDGLFNITDEDSMHNSQSIIPSLNQTELNSSDRIRHKKTRRKIYTLLLQPIHAMYRMLCILSYILQIAFICVTLWSLPAFICETFRYRAYRSRRAAMEATWHSTNHTQQSPPSTNTHLITKPRDSGQKKRAYILSCPPELIISLLRHMDVRTICRIIQTCRALHRIATDNLLWRYKFQQDWQFAHGGFVHADANSTRRNDFYAPHGRLDVPKPAIDISHSNNSKEAYQANRMLVSKTYYTLYQIRVYSSVWDRPTTFEEKIDLYGYNRVVLWTKFQYSVYCSYHCLLTPLKLCGIVTWPIYWYCRNRQFNPATPALACLRYCVSDLAFTASRCFNFENLHLFFLVNITSLLLVILDEISLVISSINCAIIWIASGFNLTFIVDSLRPSPVRFILAWTISIWQKIMIPILVLSHLQLIILPWSVIHNTSIIYLVFGYDVAPMLGNIGTFGMMTDAFGAILTNSVLLEHVMRICSVWFPISTTILFQIMWAPVICTVEEVSFQYAKETIGELSTALIMAHKFIRIFTLCFQCCFGILAYMTLIGISMVQQSARLRNTVST